MRKLISCLGFSNYENTTYYLGEESHTYQTRFIQEALLKLLPEENRPEEAIIATTPEAKKQNWEGENGLAEALADSCPEYDIHTVDIPNAKNEADIWKLFHIILGQLNEGDEVLVDITHAFRFIPMIMISVLNYAKTVKNIEVSGIYYGAFEPRSSMTAFPILNLSVYDELLDWTYATNVLINYGNAKDFAEMAREKMEKASGCGDFENRRKANDVKKMTASLNSLTQNIITCRGGVLNADKNDTIMYSYKGFSEKLKKVINSENDALDILLPLLDRIKEDTDVFACEEDGAEAIEYIGMATVKWCIDKHMVVQAMTAMVETITTHICRKIGGDNCVENREFREKIGGYAITRRCRCLRKSESETEHSEKDYTEAEWAMIESLDNGSADVLVKLSDRIKAARNDLNHFGFSSNKIDPKEIEKQVAEWYEELKKCIAVEV